MNDPRWQPISHYSDGALRRMASNPRDLRSDAAARELRRRLVYRVVIRGAQVDPEPTVSEEER